MPGANPSESLSARPDHSKSRGESSATASAADHKPPAAPKSKPSNDSKPTPINNKDSDKKPANTNPKNRLENPSPRPVNPNFISGQHPRPENPSSIFGPRPSFPSNDPPPPSYGFDMLERRSIVLADGSVRSYFALPPDYENFARMLRPGFQPEFLGLRDFGFGRLSFPMNPPFHLPDARIPNPEYWNPRPENSKRKFEEDLRAGRDDGFERQRQQLFQYGNANGPGLSVGHGSGRGEDMRASKNIRILEGSSGKLKHSEVDQNALNKAFYNFLKLVFETANQKRVYLGNGKPGHLSCLACRRCSKDFPDTHNLIMHAYNSGSEDLIVDHLAFHKALCVLMGWNYLMPPDNTKSYQNLPADDAEANLDDLIIWPPSVLIHNTVTGKGREGRMEGIGNKAMDSILRDLGFATGKSVSMFSREGHLGIHMVKFSADQQGLADALRMADYFEKHKHGRKNWACVQPSLGEDDDNNPDLTKLDPKTGEKTRVFYGHLATVADLDKVTFEIKKKVSIVSMKEYRQSK